MAQSFEMLHSGDPPWLKEAFALEGLSEIVGGKHERKILEFFAEAGHGWVKDDETAWCAAFAHAMLGRAGVEGTGSLAARSYLEWGRPAAKPRRGDVAVFKRGRSAWQGHVAFYLGETASHVLVIGGNQGNAVSVARYPKTSLLGYRRPPAAAAASPAARPPAPAVDARPAGEAAHGPSGGPGGEGFSPPRPDGPSAETILYVQTRLRQLGYAEVGRADGKVGPMTRAAILAFRADNGLELTPAIDDALLVALPKAGPRALAPERAAATPKEVRAEVPEVEASAFGKAWSAAAGAIGVAGAALSWLWEHVGAVKAQLGPVLEVLGDVPAWLYLLLFAAAAWFAWQRMRRGEAAGVAAYRQGERR